MSDRYSLTSVSNSPASEPHFNLTTLSSVFHIFQKQTGADPGSAPKDRTEHKCGQAAALNLLWIKPPSRVWRSSWKQSGTNKWQLVGAQTVANKCKDGEADFENVMLFCWTGFIQTVHTKDLSRQTKYWWLRIMQCLHIHSNCCLTSNYTLIDVNWWKWNANDIHRQLGEASCELTCQICLWNTTFGTQEHKGVSHMRNRLCDIQRTQIPGLNLHNKFCNYITTVHMAQMFLLLRKIHL